MARGQRSEHDPRRQVGRSWVDFDADMRGEDFDPDNNDAPANLCGFCGMRTTAPGDTACSSCA